MPSSSAASSSGKSTASLPNGQPIDPITRTALRYTISPREYELLHQYLVSRAPRPVLKRALSPNSFKKKVHAKGVEDGGVGGGKNDNVAAMRAALRVFVAVYVGFKGWETVMGRLAARRGGSAKATAATVPYKNVRLALSFSGIMLFHRLLHRFFRRLRTAMLEDDDGAGAFRKRNPRVAKALTSSYTPALGAALSGLCLGLSPADQLRTTLAIYLFTRSLEFAYNAAEENGYLWKRKEDGSSGRPWWFGSWMLMPFACGQLLHAFVFDRDCFPESYGRFILKRSPEYIQTRPPIYPTSKPWPGTFDIVDALAELSRLRWPPFTSPILFPSKTPTDTLGPKLAHIAPITSSAHPGIKHTSCAILHPSDPSCARTYLKFFLSAFPSTVRFITLIYSAFALLAYKSLLKTPLPFLNRLGERILRLSLFLTGAIGTSWMSICLFAHRLPRSTLPTHRWFLGGFLGGLWAFVARKKERGNFLYSARLSIDSAWKVGAKRGWWKAVPGGDVLLFTASLALLGATFERFPGAVRGAVVRKAMGVLRNEGFVDRVVAGKGESVGQEEVEEEVVGEKVKEA